MTTKAESQAGVKSTVNAFTDKFGVYPPVLRPKDAAAYIGVSYAHLWRMVDEGRLAPPAKPSAGISLFKTADLDSYLSGLFCKV